MVFNFTEELERFMTHEAPGCQVIVNDYYRHNETIMRKLKSKSPVKQDI